MINTYLSWQYHVSFFLMSFLSFKFLGIFYAGVIAFVYLMIAWLFRIDHISEKYDLVFGNLVVPFSGKIKQIGQTQHLLIPVDYRCIEFNYNWCNGYGIYFPRALEVYDIVKNENEVFINLKTDDDESMVIHFKKNIFGFLPKLWIYPGDRGKLGAGMGYFPFGGNLFFIYQINIF